MSPCNDNNLCSLLPVLLAVLLPVQNAMGSVVTAYVLNYPRNNTARTTDTQCASRNLYIIVRGKEPIVLRLDYVPTCYVYSTVTDSKITPRFFNKYFVLYRKCTITYREYTYTVNGSVYIIVWSVEY